MTRSPRSRPATARTRYDAMIRWVLTTFIALTILSASLPWMKKLGIGRLPGDFTLRMFGREYPFPFMSTILLSLVLSLLARAL